jgi:hypothetical protein
MTQTLEHPLTVTPATDACGRCMRPVSGSTVLSTHRTSGGVLRYRRCGCGRTLVQLGEDLVATVRR